MKLQSVLHKKAEVIPPIPGSFLDVAMKTLVAARLLGLLRNDSNIQRPGKLINLLIQRLS